MANILRSGIAPSFRSFLGSNSFPVRTAVQHHVSANRFLRQLSSVPTLQRASPCRATIAQWPSRGPNTISRTHIKTPVISSFLGQQQQKRAQSGGRWRPRRPRNDEKYIYHTFGGQGGKGPFHRVQVFWDQYWAVIITVGAFGGGFYVYHLEEVPMTGRRRFNCISHEQEIRMGEQGYKEIVKQYRGRILPDNHPDTMLVRRVLSRLITPAKLQDPKMGNLRWEAYVIQDEEMNAFVLPGGKVFVHTGILPLCQDEDGLAAVLGHEIAHVCAHHPAESISSRILVTGAAILVSLFLDISGNLSSTMLNLLFSLPNSRAQEAEADQIGLMMMAKGCYNPEAAAGLWSRMHQAEKISHPQLLSTHPSNYRRLQSIRGWLPQANNVYEDSECHITSRYARDFGHAFDSLIW